MIRRLINKIITCRATLLPTRTPIKGTRGRGDQYSRGAHS